MKRKALITGGSRGIGAAIALRLRAEGHEVFTPPRAEVDLSSIESVKTFVSSQSSDFDILVNNAGINPIMKLDEMQSESLMDVIHVNLVAPVLLMQFCARGMAARGFGRIVNLSSIWGTVSKPGRGAYSATKAGIEGITRTVALEYASAGVLVNAVAPGFIKTELTTLNNSKEELQRIADSLPVEGLPNPRRSLNWSSSSAQKGIPSSPVKLY